VNEQKAQQRLDKWLWAARFFKTRALASEAVSGGKVHLNGVRVKPSRGVKEGDQLHITKDQLEYRLVIKALNPKRRPAKEAVLLYEESIESIEARQQRISEIKILNAHMPFSEKRPGKKERRQIVRFIRKQN
jgi:ribosome-associated heat shock protein Hsp15